MTPEYSTFRREISAFLLQSIDCGGFRSLNLFFRGFPIFLRLKESIYSMLEIVSVISARLNHNLEMDNFFYWEFWRRYDVAELFLRSQSIKNRLI